MSTRQVAGKSLAALLVRSARGSAAATAVPGLAGADGGVQGAPGVPRLVVPPKPVEPPRVPPPPAETIRPEPAPATPEPERPAIEPLFAWAPGLNWAGPGDHWAQAWDAEQHPVPDPAPLTAPIPGSAADLPPTPRDLELIAATLAAVEPVADRATAHFYALLFLHYPQLRSLFPAAMDVQRDRLFRALLLAARGVGDPVALTAQLGALGRGHRKYGTLAAHYGPVGECLLAALARYAGGRWDAEAELAWRRAYRMVSQIMIDAAEQAARTAPPWWQGEVVSHQVRGRDVAVLTVRPDQPYPYRAGQYATLETPWWPRVWRNYSFATAPRPDGLLTFHVRAVQAGWVSNALLRRARPGDVLRLGPPAGRMVLDHADPTPLLCVGGGTGIAPISALVEDVAEHGSAGRTVQVLYGARRADDLYQLEAMRQLERRHPWLAVRPVLSEPGGTAGEPGGLLSDVAAQLGPWDGHRAFLAGPAAMVRRAVAALARSGVHPELIRHDLPEE
ncbi:NAD(P)H-flavin reductase/hemoglobin-like flavoprotein [Kitasatospora sp. GP30]|uniref:globin domain-containing protein n=1 Tax=Kitasatospora sp. GP30 TaxID=3035084 RepID=UPI0024771956|nr:globin domain-containing protein [Kitasatospora sp. GP30]MDH6141583.1 NAD(P)H-flavin reductase/hemoglobin-like flavoprotein [Kitasatospora sp. GP30]